MRTEPRPSRRSSAATPSSTRLPRRCRGRRSSSAAAAPCCCVGEPGIGKSRLLEAAAAARPRSGRRRARGGGLRSRVDSPVRAVRRRAAQARAGRGHGGLRPRRSSANRDRLFERLGELIAERARHAARRAEVRRPAVERRVERGRVALRRSHERRSAACSSCSRRAATSCATTRRSARALRELRQAGLLEEIDARGRSARTPCARSSARARRRPTPSD